jgi:hypothetical protein
MAQGLNVQLKDALDHWLSAIRAQLAAAPPPAPPAKPTGWVSAVPTDSDMPPPQPKPRWAAAVPTGSAMPSGPADPKLHRLDELIAALADASTIKEGVDTVERLARRMKRCESIALDMESKLQFNSIKLSSGGNSSVTFGKIRGCIQLARRYYDKLEYYKTDEGKNHLKGVASVKLDLDREGDVAVRDHHFDERIDPLASVRNWSYSKDYLPWANRRVKENSDPIEHVVEFLIDLTTRSNALTTFLFNIEPPKDSRMHGTDDVGEALDVKVRAHVKGDEKFSDPRGAPRMWTYQVKAPTRQRDDRNEVGRSVLGSWEWTCDIWSGGAFSLPILRVVHSVAGESSRRGITNDFTRGTLYAMRGPSVMRCYPALKFHSALFNAEMTSAAGILVADEGRVVAIDNRSGHYQPGYRQLQTAVQFLQSNLLFDHDAIVSVYVADADALYFSPADFLAAAQSGMDFRVVTGFIARRAQQYGDRLPVATRLADLIPAMLRDFPMHDGRNRWDRMLANYYGGEGGLETIVKDLKAALKPQWAIGRTEVAKSTAGRRQEDHAALAARTLRAIESGGAYYNLIELLRALITATQPTNEAGQNSLTKANLRYRGIAGRLAALKPNRDFF